MVPAPSRNAAGAGKSGQGTTSAGRTDKPIERKSVDGDGCWDVAASDALDCFQFVGAKVSTSHTTRRKQSGRQTE